jgi:hypothetical protein
MAISSGAIACFPAWLFVYLQYGNQLENNLIQLHAWEWHWAHPSTPITQADNDNAGSKHASEFVHG